MKDKIMRHSFTPIILTVLEKHFKEQAKSIYENSTLLQYINFKTVSASKGSKARSSFGNLYAIFVLAEDYIKNNFHKDGNYSEYEGAQFSNLFSRQRELPFGSKLQNHALNHRMNQEFRKYFPNVDSIPILRVPETKRYWLNEKLFLIKVDSKEYNIVESIIEIIEKYIETKQSSFKGFINDCEKLKAISTEKPIEAVDFITSLIAPNVDARIFEIVSYSILKHFFQEQILYFGFDVDNLDQSPLVLYKTGRTNANDGGIDFVMKPLGRFFQVTETLDVKKYFLDIDKIERYPITFVIKSTESVEALFKRLRMGAELQYSIKAIVEKYMKCIEEIINIPILLERFMEAKEQGHLSEIIDEIVAQSKVEFNQED